MKELSEALISHDRIGKQPRRHHGGIRQVSVSFCRGTIRERHGKAKAESGYERYGGSVGVPIV